MGVMPPQGSPHMQLRKKHSLDETGAMIAVLITWIDQKHGLMKWLDEYASAPVSIGSSSTKTTAPVISLTEYTGLALQFTLSTSSANAGTARSTATLLKQTHDQLIQWWNVWTEFQGCYEQIEKERGQLTTPLSGLGEEEQDRGKPHSDSGSKPKEEAGGGNDTRKDSGTTDSNKRTSSEKYGDTLIPMDVTLPENITSISNTGVKENSDIMVPMDVTLSKDNSKSEREVSEESGHAKGSGPNRKQHQEPQVLDSAEVAWKSVVTVHQKLYLETEQDSSSRPVRSRVLLGLMVWAGGLNGTNSENTTSNLSASSTDNDTIQNGGTVSTVSEPSSGSKVKVEENSRSLEGNDLQKWILDNLTDPSHKRELKALYERYQEQQGATNLPHSSFQRNFDPFIMLNAYRKFRKGAGGYNPAVVLEPASTVLPPRAPLTKTAIDSSVNSSVNGKSHVATKHVESTWPATEVRIKVHVDSQNEKPKTTDTRGGGGTEMDPAEASKKRPSTPKDKALPQSRKRAKQDTQEPATDAQRWGAAMAMAVNEVCGRNRSMDPSPFVITHVMELTEWTVGILSIEYVAPTQNLLQILQDSSSQQPWTSVLIPILNRTLLRLSQESLVERTTRTAPVSLTKAEGVVHIHGNVTDDKRMGRAVVALYYFALEALLCSELETLFPLLSSNPTNSISLQQQKLVQNTVFHRALLACCCWCVTKAVGATQKIRPAPCVQAISVQTTLKVCDCNPHDLLKVSDSFVRALSIESRQANTLMASCLPRSLTRDLRHLEGIVLDALVWSTALVSTGSGSLPEQVDDFHRRPSSKLTFWPPEVLAAASIEKQTTGKEKQSETEERYPTMNHSDGPAYRSVNSLLRKVLNVSHDRMESLCEHLGVPAPVPLLDRAWENFRHLLRYHIYLLFDRHVDQWILCCLYGLARALSYPLLFADLIQSYLAIRGPQLGDITCQLVLRHVSLDGVETAASLKSRQPPSGGELVVGDVIALYNLVWVPTMKAHLMQQKSIQEDAAAVRVFLEQQPTEPKPKGKP